MASALLPLMVIVFIGFLVVGLSLPILPLHVHHELGQGPTLVGMVTGAQFVTAVATRMWAGRYADTRGPKRAMVLGLAAAAASGVLYMVSDHLVGQPNVAASVLLIGRAILGGGESFIITGALGWGVALAGSENTGKVMAWIGTAMYGAFAAGAPAGTMLYTSRGFAAIAAATFLIPLLTLCLIAFLRGVQPQATARPSLLGVLKSVWMPGVGLAMSSIGFGAITAFAALLFAERGWQPGWPAFTSFAVCFMLARTFLGHLVDRWGGLRITAVSLVIEASGQFLLWRAHSIEMGILGAALTGLGYSLVYPGLGVEAVRRAPPESRALAMGAYTVCLDIALGFGSPALGAVASHTGFGGVFLIAALSVLGGLLVVAGLAKKSPTTSA